MRKSKSTIDNLPANQREALERWLFDDSPKLTYAQAKERLWQDFNVRCSESSLSVWWQARSQERVLSRIGQSAIKSRSVVQEFRNQQSQAFDALMELIGQAAFEMKLRGEELNLETLRGLADIAALGLKAKTEAKKMEQKDVELGFSGRRVAVMEKKAAAFDEAKQVSGNKKLTPEQKQAEYRRIFGMS